MTAVARLVVVALAGLSVGACTPSKPIMLSGDLPPPQPAGGPPVEVRVSVAIAGDTALVHPNWVMGREELMAAVVNELSAQGVSDVVDVPEGEYSIKARFADISPGDMSAIVVSSSWTLYAAGESEAIAELSIFHEEKVSSTTRFFYGKPELDLAARVVGANVAEGVAYLVGVLRARGGGR